MILTLYPKLKKLYPYLYMQEPIVNACLIPQVGGQRDVYIGITAPQV